MPAIEYNPPSGPSSKPLDTAAASNFAGAYGAGDGGAYGAGDAGAYVEEAARRDHAQAGRGACGHVHSSDRKRS